MVNDMGHNIVSRGAYAIMQKGSLSEDQLYEFFNQTYGNATAARAYASVLTTDANYGFNQLSNIRKWINAFNSTDDNEALAFDLELASYFGLDRQVIEGLKERLREEYDEASKEFLKSLDPPASDP